MLQSTDKSWLNSPLSSFEDHHEVPPVSARSARRQCRVPSAPVPASQPCRGGVVDGPPGAGYTSRDRGPVTCGAASAPVATRGPTVSGRTGSTLRHTYIQRPDCERADRLHTETYIHTGIHTYIPPRIRTDGHTWIHTHTQQPAGKCRRSGGGLK